MIPLPGRGIIDPDWPRFQDTCKKWSQGQPERERLGVEGEGQYVHVQDVLAETSDVLAHVGAETRHQVTGWPSSAMAASASVMSARPCHVGGGLAVTVL